MPKLAKAKKEKSGSVLFYFTLLIVCLGAVLFLAFNTFAQDFILDAKIVKIEEVGESERVDVKFNRPITSISLDNIQIEPFIGFSYELSENKENLTIIQNDKFSLEQKYTITLRNIRGISGFPINSRELVFYTQKKDNETVKTETSGGQYFAELTLSKDKYVPPAASTVKKPVQITPHILEGKYIDVSISKQIMTIFENGAQVNQFLVSTGKVGMPTPLGEYKVQRKEVNHWSSKYKLWMPYSMNFTGGYYVHELPYWPNGYREGEAHLGKRVSHGCVRLGLGSAKYVFDWAEIGTPIYIHN